jgi:hypothetical protein
MTDRITLAERVLAWLQGQTEASIISAEIECSHRIARAKKREAAIAMLRRRYFA